MTRYAFYDAYGLQLTCWCYFYLLELVNRTSEKIQIMLSIALAQISLE